MATNPAATSKPDKPGMPPADGGKQQHFLQRIQLFSLLSWPD